MDALVPKTKEIFPDADDAELDAMLSAVREVAPNAGDDEILKVTQAVKAEHDKTAGARNYVKEKYGIGERNKIVEQNAAESSGGNGAAALAALGAGLAGRDATAAGQAVLSNQKAARDSKLTNFDKSRDLAMSEQENAESEEKKLARKDPNSELSKQMQQMAVEDYGMSPETAAKIPAEILEARLPALKYKADRADKLKDQQFRREELTAQNAFKRNESELRRDETALRREELASQKDLVRQDKLDKEAKLSDKQIEAFTDLDNAKSDLGNILSQLDKESSWTGPVDGRIPDMLIGDDQAAWRSAVGKYKDAYRKAITGAGAGPREIEILERRLPTETDTYANFVAKAKEAEKELERRRSSLAENLEKGGKNVSQFKGAPKEETKVVQGVVYRKVPGGWEEVDKNAQVSN